MLVKEKSPALIKDCFLTDENTVRVENEVGVLVYTDSISAFKMPNAKYLIYESNAGGIKLPLEVCDLPDTMFVFLDIGDSVSVGFSGRVEVIDSLTDAFSARIELTSIKPLGAK